MMATNSPAVDREAHAVERAQLGVAQHVDLRQDPGRHDERSAPW